MTDLFPKAKQLNLNQEPFFLTRLWKSALTIADSRTTGTRYWKDCSSQWTTFNFCNDFITVASLQNLDDGASNVRNVSFSYFNSSKKRKTLHFLAFNTNSKKNSLKQ